MVLGSDYDVFHSCSLGQLYPGFRIIFHGIELGCQGFIFIYRDLCTKHYPFTDAGNLAILLMEVMGNDSLEEAKAVVLKGISNFPLKADYYVEIGQRIVEATGDKNFRQQLESAVAERGKSG